MAISRTPMIDDDGSGTTGTIFNNAWKQELYNQIDALVGPWIDVPFNPANFHGSGGMTWTVSSASVMYQLVGGTCAITWTIVGTFAGTAAAGIYFDLPTPGPMPASDAGTLCRLLQATWDAGAAYVSADAPRVNLATLSTGPFTIGSMVSQGEMFFRVR